MKELLNISKFNRYTHQPCVFLSIAFGVGICLGRYAPWTWALWSIWSGIFIVISLLKHKISSFALVLSIVCLGALYFQHSYLLPTNHVSFLSFQDQMNVEAVEGIIDSDAQLKPTIYGTKKIFELQVLRINVEENWQKNEGRILVNVFKDIDLNYGDHVILQGVLRKPFSQKTSKFSYQQYLEDHGLFFILNVGKNKEINILAHHQANAWLGCCFRIKHAFKDILARYLDPQEASMIQAMLLGDRSFLTKDMYALFSKTGTSHILAISGMNMTIIGGVFLFILKILRLPRQIQFILTGVLLFVYAVLSGWTASVVRSVLMAAIVLSSFCFEYEGDTANSLGLAAIVLFLLNPMNLFDIGFQLSFICVASIISLYPLIQSLSKRYIKTKAVIYLAQALGISVVAWAGTIALIAYEFNIVSLIAIIANVFIVPLADVIVVLSLGLVATGFVCPFLGFAFAGILKIVFNFTLFLIAFFAQIPGGYFYIDQIDLWQVFLYYCILAVFVLIVNWLCRFFTRG